MHNPNRQQLTALATVCRSPDLEAFRNYLQEALSSTTGDLRHISDLDTLRQQQGKAQLLEGLIERIETAPEALEKLRNQ